MKTHKRDSKVLEWIIIATSIFRFYYYTIRRSEKRYDIAANQKEAVMTMFSPVIMILVYPFISGTFMSEALSMGTTFLLIPLFVLNFMYLNHISNEGYRIRRAKLDKEHEEEVEELRKVKEKELEDYIRRMYKEQARQQREKEFKRDRAYQKASIDQNKLNAIRLMNLSDKPSIEEVKKRYRKLSKTHHPDVGGTHENFIRLTKAYEYLVKVL